MTIYDELKARGLLAQLTDEEEIKNLIAETCDILYVMPTKINLKAGAGDDED